MKKCLKNSLIIFWVVLVFILSDTLQAKLFDNSPLLKVRQYYTGCNINYIDDGLLVRHYEFTDGTKQTIFNWQSVLY